MWFLEQFAEIPINLQACNLCDCNGTLRFLILTMTSDTSKKKNGPKNLRDQSRWNDNNDKLINIKPIAPAAPVHKSAPTNQHNASFTQSLDAIVLASPGTRFSSQACKVLNLYSPVTCLLIYYQSSERW